MCNTKSLPTTMTSTGTSLIFPLTCLVPLIKLHHHQSHTPPSPITNTTLNNHTTLTNHTLQTPISHKPHRSPSTLTNHTLHPPQSHNPPSPNKHSTLTNHTSQVSLSSWTDEAILGRDRIILHTTLQRIFTIPRLRLWPLLLLFPLLPQVSLSHL